MIQEGIKRAIEGALAELGIKNAPIVLEHPAELSHGDYATSVALSASKAAGMNPRQLADAIVEKLALPAGVSKTEIAGPGVSNFHLTRNFFADSIDAVLALGEGWGRNAQLDGQKIIVEYTDPNPFKELHIGHLVPNAIGESLARLFMASGAEVKRVTFQGDVGMHVAKAIWGMQKMGEVTTAAELGVAYAKGATAFDEDPHAADEIKKLNTAIYERSDASVNALYDTGRALSLAYFEAAYKILGSHFDHNFFESETGPIGLEKVKANIGTLFKESDGAVIFPGEEYGLHTRVFINAEGLPTYEAKDIGLIEAKQKWFPFDRSLTVTATEQRSYFTVMLKAAELLYPELSGKVEGVFNGMLKLSEGKMSSRTGNVVPAMSLINDVAERVLALMKESETPDRAVATQVAVSAIKYAILRSEAGRDMVFDFKTSISFEGDSGPYLLYTHARAHSVVVKDSFETETPAPVPPEAYRIERILYRFPEVVERSATERSAHHLITYLTELSSAFNSFYANEKIIDAADLYSPFKIKLTRAVMLTLKNGLWMVGMEAPERM